MSQKVIDGVIAAWNEGALGGLDAVVGAGVARRAPASLNSNAASLEEFKGRISAMRTAFPDANIAVRDVNLFGDRGFLQWTFTGTNTGPGDFPPTGKSVEVSGASLVRFEDGKLIEELVFFDASEMLSQLGLIQMPEA
jgi:predicted ester cyclase